MDVGQGRGSGRLTGLAAEGLQIGRCAGQPVRDVLARSHAVAGKVAVGLFMSGHESAEISVPREIEPAGARVQRVMRGSRIGPEPFP